MDPYEAKARDVVAELTRTKGLELLAEDRPFLDFIMELLKELLPVLIGCFGGAATAAAGELRRPGLLTRARLRLGIRRALRDNDTVNVLAGPLFHAVLTVAQTTTDADVEAMAAASS